MASMNKTCDWIHVYVVYRIDQDINRYPPDPGDADFDDMFYDINVTIKEVLTDSDEAEKEVERLNKLNKDFAMYAYQCAKFYPNGRKVEE